MRHRAVRPDRILAVKLADFGDALLTTPALAALRETYPASRLDVLCSPAAACVYRHTGLVDEIIDFEKSAYDSVRGLLLRPLAPLLLGRELRGRNYDAVVLFHHLTTRYGAVKHASLALATGAPIRAGLARRGSRRASFLTHRAEDVGFDERSEVASAMAVVAQLGASQRERPLKFHPGAEAQQQAELLLSAVPAGRPIAAIHPGSGDYSVARRWPPERFAAVADALSKRGVATVLVGAGSDPCAEVLAHCTSRIIDLSGATDLPVLASLLARSSVLVCNDSGVMHLATAMGTPVVAVFGPSNHVAWGPWWPSPTDATSPDPGQCPHEVVRLGLSCQPCLYRGFALGSKAGCPTRDCLTWLGTERVIAAASRVLDRGVSG